MGVGKRFSSVVAFLRAGYPSAAPAVGYAPVLALLPRRASDDEVTAIASRLLAAQRRTICGRLDSADVAVGITRVTHEMPLLGDIERVQRRLAADGASQPG